MFHDASVSRIERVGDALHLKIEAFSLGPGERMLPARLVIGGIGEIYRNDERVDDVRIESEDAEIHGLDVSARGVELALIWHRWSLEAPDLYTFYRFPGASARAHDLAGGPPVIVPDP